MIYGNDRAPDPPPRTGHLYVTSPYGTPQNPAIPERAAKKRRVFGWIKPLIPILGFALLFFGGSYVMTPEPDVEIQSGMAFATVNGADAVLVPYERTGSRGMFQMMFQDMFQVRITAVDLATGRQIWDVKLSDELIWDVEVIAVGRNNAYVATPDGLMVLALADGEILAEPDGIAGLEGNYVAAYAAYRFDPGANAVVAMDRDGRVHVIALDTLRANPADPRIADAWQGRLSAETGSVTVTGKAETEAFSGPDELLAMQPIQTGALATSLVSITLPGKTTPIGDAVFYEAELIIDQTRIVAGELITEPVARGWQDYEEFYISDDLGIAAGAPSGIVLVQHKETSGDGPTVLSSVSLKSGQVIDSVELYSDAGRCLVTEDGRMVLPVSGTDAYGDRMLAVIAANGTISTVAIGETNFFGF